MNIATKLLDMVFPDGARERELMKAAIHQNRIETNNLTEVMKQAAFRPDQTMRLRVGEWNEKK